MNYDIRKLNEVKYFKHNHIIILAYICRWIAGECPPVHREYDGRMYYWFSLNKIAQDLSLSYQQVLLALRRLKNQDKKINYVTEPLIYEKVEFKTHQMFLSVNLEALRPLIECEEGTKVLKIDFDAIQKRICGNTYYTKRINMGSELFDVNRSTYCAEADAIARLILKKYPQYFSHRIPEGNASATKTYVSICRAVADLHDGRFIRERILSEKFLGNKQFDIEGWQSKVKAVKGDWVAVKRLILGALKNFVLMHDENRMPYSKNYLQKNLSLWFYDNVSVRGEGQSQFILCLSEPEYTKKHNSEAKADRIFETLPVKAKKGGNELFEMNTSMPAGIFWEKVKDMVEWGKGAFEVEDNIRYWVSSAGELPAKFADYCRNNGIDVSLATVDIKRAVESNAPWTWFVRDACAKHGLNARLAECVDESDMRDFFKPAKKKAFADKVVF